MKNSVFEFDDYKAYILGYTAALPGHGHGFRATIARSLNVHSAFITQVLNSNAHFSLEQAEELNNLLEHNKDESEFFLLLVQLARAGTPRLKKRIQGQIQQAIRTRTNIQERVKINNQLSPDEQTTYYSSWQYTAVHIILTIPQFRTVEEIAVVLKIPKLKVKLILEFLTSVNLVKFEAGEYLSTTFHIFIGRDSENISKHHTNWRIKAIDSLDDDPEVNLHLSTALSLSRVDYLKIREDLTKKIQESLDRVKTSKEEMLCGFNIDFFRLSE